MVHTSIETCFSSELSKRNDTRVHVHTQCAMERPVARGGGVPSDDVGPAPGPAAHSLSPEALEAHVQAACDALRSGGTFGVLDLRGHPDAGAAIDTILASASDPGALRALNLHTLNLEFALNVTDAHVRAMAECGTLVDVNLNATSEVGDGAVEAFAPRASRSGRLTSSGGFGSPVGVSGALDPNLDDAFLFDEMRIDARRSETGFGSGSLRSSMAFSSFGATPLAAPRDARPARRPGRAGTVEADASSPARVVEGFAEDARKGRGRDGAT